MHPGAAAGGLPEGPAHRQSAAGGPGRAGRRQSVVAGGPAASRRARHRRLATRSPSRPASAAAVVAAPVAAPAPAAPAPPPQPAAPAAAPVAASSPDYGMSVFLWGHSDTTSRDLKLVTDLGFRWQKTLFQWRADRRRLQGLLRLVRSRPRGQGQRRRPACRSSRGWTFSPPGRARTARSNGPPDNYQDYADFVSAFVNRYCRGFDHRSRRRHRGLERSQPGPRVGQRDDQQAASRRLRALARWRLLRPPKPPTRRSRSSPPACRQRASPTATPPTTSSTCSGCSTPVCKGNYDVLGAHGNTQAPKWMRRLGSLTRLSARAASISDAIEQLRDVMVKNGDADKRVWLLEFGWTADTLHPNYSLVRGQRGQESRQHPEGAPVRSRHWQPWIGVMTLWTAARSDAGRPTAKSTGGRSPTPTARPRAAYTGLLQARRGGALAGLSPGT